MPGKPGRPRKYASKEEKAQHDVAAKRARRRFRSLVTRRNSRFRPYDLQSAEATYASSSERSDSLSVSRLDVLAAAAYSIQQIDPTTEQSSLSQHIPSATPSTTEISSVRWISPCPQPSCDAYSGQAGCHKPAPTSESSEARPVSSLKTISGSDELFTNDDSTMNRISPSSPLHVAEPSDADSGDSMQSFLGHTNDRAESEIEREDSAGHCMIGGVSSTLQGIGKIQGRDSVVEEVTSNYGFSDISSEMDSDMESDSSSAQSEEESHNEPDVVPESDHALAKAFLESTWSRQCDCRHEASTALGSQNVFSLQKMTEYWRGLGVPDSIGTAPVVSEPVEVEDEGEERNANTNTELNWSAILSGGDDRPILNIEMSQIGAPVIERTWDVDSIISWASCLSINRGLYISYHPPASRNFRSSVHVFHKRDPLHLIPHFRLGSGRQSPQFGVIIPDLMMM
ncbi:hypothetical protein FNYG_14112 [Fusarium nygamai]|uniref:Uncharacterized protein n=1 Tax=Gibberella nygamai TaxID=42673 RepID=A0A2K0UTS0_GIBNY|nr:hypothetical protein FNYG_14112 [Fusarium nygamai]